VKLIYLASHPIQYHVPLFRALTERCTFEAWFAHRQDARAQADAGYGVAFDWDIDLHDGYVHRYLYNVARDPSVSRYGGCDTPTIEATLRDAKPDALVVGGWHLKTYWQAIAAARDLGVPVYVRTDSVWRRDEPAWRRVAKRLLYRWALRRATGFLAAGIRSRAYLLDLGIPAESIAIVPHTIDVTRFAAHGRRAAPDDCTTVAFVGRLLEHKRVADLIDAVAALRDGPVRLVVIGDGPERAMLTQRAREAGIACEFAGFVNQQQLPAMLARVDVLSLPSIDDTWGLVVNEALAAGAAAVVCEDIGCAADLGAEASVVLTHRARDIMHLRDQLSRAIGLRREPGFDERRRALVRSFSPAVAATAMLHACRRCLA
jgi:glycosyltransferase involved in cell wall biosynthesis